MLAQIQTALVLPMDHRVATTMSDLRQAQHFILLEHTKAVSDQWKLWSLWNSLRQLSRPKPTHRPESPMALFKMAAPLKKGSRSGDLKVQLDGKATLRHFLSLYPVSSIPTRSFLSNIEPVSLLFQTRYATIWG